MFGNEFFTNNDGSTSHEMQLYSVGAKLLGELSEIARALEWELECSVRGLLREQIVLPTRSRASSFIPNDGLPTGCYWSTGALWLAVRWRSASRLP